MWIGDLKHWLEILIKVVVIGYDLDRLPKGSGVDVPSEPRWLFIAAFAYTLSDLTFDQGRTIWKLM
jgi:hypothetical protein